ncbi:Transgelin-3 [Balamuthia mandrillaris]
MAFHGPSYGLDAELAAKQASKLDPARMREAAEYIQDKTGTRVGYNSKDDFAEPLKSGIFLKNISLMGMKVNLLTFFLVVGVVLCNMINKIRPGIVSKINNGKMPFVQMENINAYLTACEQLGLRKSDCFMTVDLFEAKNMVPVIDNILALKNRYP